MKLEGMFCCHEQVITSPRELLSKLPLLADAALVWTMHFHSFVPPAAAAAAPATCCCSQRGQLPDDPRDPPTSSSCAASLPPSSAAPTASHPLDPHCRNINDGALVFIIVIAGGGGGRKPVIRGPDRFGGWHHRGLERIPRTSRPLQGGRDFFHPHPHHEHHLVIGGICNDRWETRTPAHS